MRNLQVVDRAPVARPQTQALDRLARAISVVSACADGSPHAATIDSFTVVSIEPPLVMVSLTTGSTTLATIERAGSFGVSVLAFDQEPLARRFASRSRARGAGQFEGVDADPGHWTKAPLLHGVLAWFECAVHNQTVAGDHVMVLGKILEGGVGSTGKPGLLRQDRAYRT